MKSVLWDKPKVEVFIDLTGRNLTSGSAINISASEIAKLDKDFIFKIKNGDVINTYTKYHIDKEDNELKIVIDLLDFKNNHYVIIGNTLTYESGEGYFMDTDKTLSIANLPADSKATGDAIKAVEDEVDGVKGDLISLDTRVKTLESGTIKRLVLTLDGQEVTANMTPAEAYTAIINGEIDKAYVTYNGTEYGIAWLKYMDTDPVYYDCQFVLIDYEMDITVGVDAIYDIHLSANGFAMSIYPD